SPGVTIGGVDIPLNPDAFTDFSIAQAGSVFLPGSVGTLDATGSVSAGLDTQGPFSASFAGLELILVVVMFDGSGSPTHATAPTAISLVP
ncbi:MAG: hypothetical protein O7B99_15300, partial [Planctomycetota bacterium]|nr:hypothetical protein [Planctomycetota bacterium]